MSTYIILGRLTFRALDQMKEIAERDAKAAEIIKNAGGRMVFLYYTFGEYDFVAGIEAPSPDAMAKILLEIGKMGTVSTHTLTALTPDKIYSIVSQGA
jgi:uncharacterized protein with GYD domain